MQPPELTRPDSESRSDRADRDRIGTVERRGIDMVPPTQRQAVPRDFLWIWHSAQFSFGTVVLGAVPITLGLGWWPTVTAVLSGLLLGVVVFAPLVRFGRRTGANDPVSSGAHFGIRGRVLANLITIVVAIGFFAIATWTGASAVLVAAHRVFGTATTSTALAAVIPAVVAMVAVVAVYGHRTLLATYRAMTVTGASVLLALVLILAPRFDSSYAGGAYVLDGFWPTWLLAVSFAATLPISYATFQGDYSRYLHPRTTDRAAMLWSGASMYTSNAAALLVGAYVTTMLDNSDVPWIVGLAGTVPSWFVVVVVAFGVAGTLPQAALCLYAAGLSAQSVFWRTSRATTTAAMAVLGMAVLYLGAIAYNAMDAIAAFVPALLVLVSPWAAIMLVGFALHRGRYDPIELHTFATPGHRGRYWYTHGVNPRALAAFAPAVILGVLFMDNTLYSGPLAARADGVDISWLVPFAVAALLFYLLNIAKPAHAAIDLSGQEGSHDHS